jgi:hypothetical protein
METPAEEQQFNPILDTAEQTTPVTTQQRSSVPLYAAFALIVIAVGAGAFYLGKETSQIQPEPTPVVAEVPEMTPAPVENTAPAEETEEATTVTDTEDVTIPADWVPYTGTDQSYGFTTTMFTPPSFTFSFSGSEWSIFTANGTELWDYSTSVWLKDDKPFNHYSGQPRRQWFSEYLAGKYFEEISAGFEPSTISTVVEHKIGNTSYLEVSVTGGTHMRFSGAPVEKQYVFVQNGIVHIVRPTSDAAKAELPTYIGRMFASLSSKMI